MEEKKYSRLGIASFIISMVSAVLIFLLIAIAGMIEISTPGGISKKPEDALIIGLLLFAFWGISFVALGLGIGGLVQKNRKKIFAILGTVYSVSILAGTIFFIILGMVTH